MTLLNALDRDYRQCFVLKLGLSCLQTDFAYSGGGNFACYAMPAVFLWGAFQVGVPVKAVCVCAPVKLYCMYYIKIYCIWICNGVHYTLIWTKSVVICQCWSSSAVVPQHQRTCAVKCYEDVTMETAGPWERWPCMWVCLWERGGIYSKKEQ